MLAFLKRCTPFLFVFFMLAWVDAGFNTEYADARSKSGGRSFSSPSSQPSPPPVPQSAPSGFGQQRQQTPQQPAPGGFGRGLMGGLLGGALGGLLFGSLFGASGSGMGILPLLLLGGVGYFLYKRFANRPRAPISPGFQSPPEPNRFQSGLGSFGGQSVPPEPPVPPVRPVNAVEQGIADIRLNDPGFDEKYFLEVASDVFFKIQAGWMRRELDSYGHLLGSKLAEEYAQHFAKMRELGQINKLESIAIRKVEIVAAGSTNGEDFITVLFTANLLDYTVDEKTGAVVEGSTTEPVKFAEQWTWARPVRTEDWKLEGIEVVVD
jgi:predicted lipid-binding transport protein (Tim44 family)